MTERNPFADTRTVLQIEATECGAACLSMVLQFYGQYVPLEQLRLETDVSRDGCSAGNIVRAAQRRGLQCDGYQTEAADLGKMAPPCILWWDRNHFVVYEGMKNGQCFINDPAYGKRRMDAQRLAEHFSGIVLTFEPRPAFQEFPEYGMKPKTYLRSGRAGAFLRSHRFRAACAIVIGLLSTAAGLTAAGVPARYHGIELLFPPKDMADEFGTAFCLLMICLFLFLFCRIASEQMLRRLEDVNELQMSWRFLRQLFRMPVPFLAQRSPGDLVERVRRNDRISRFTAGDMLRSIIDAGGLLFCLLFACICDGRAAGVILITLALICVLQILQERMIVHDRTRAAICEAGLAGTVLSGIGKLETIRNLDLGPRYAAEADRYQHAAVQIRRRLKNADLTGAVIRPILYGTCLIAILQMGHHEDGAPMLFAWLILFLLMIPAAESLIRTMIRVRQIDDEIGSVDDIAEHTADPARGDTNAVPRESQQYHKLQGNIRCLKVAFAYGAFGGRIVEDLNLYLPVGSSLAVTGPSGSGKSTIGKLFGGLLTPSEGVILYDGMSMERIPERVIYASIAMVEQKSRLFAGSIRDNITMWNPNITEADLQEAIADSCIEEVIASRPEGLLTMLGERGAGLSGGEQQRLEIARALVTNPSILILDEAFSAIDDETTDRIMSNIRRRGCTCIVMTHDPLVADSCGQWLDLREGGGDA